MGRIARAVVLLIFEAASNSGNFLSLHSRSNKMPFPIIVGAVVGVVTGGIVVSGVIIEATKDDHSDHSDYSDAERRRLEQEKKKRVAEAAKRRIAEIKKNAVEELRDMARMEEVEIPASHGADEMPEAIGKALVEHFDKEIAERQQTLDQLNALQERIAAFCLTRRKED
jgi:mannitol-specific phosphotransferase system IIBC component